MHEMNQPHDLDRIYALMMDALDGPLSSEEQGQLDSAFLPHPELAAEWQAILMVDALLLEAPTVAPPNRFAARTIARVPDWRARRIGRHQHMPDLSPHGK